MRRDELPPMERAVSDTLDEWLSRLHGVLTSWNGPIEFLEWLGNRGYVVRSKDEVAQLEAELEEHDAYYKKIINEECATDEIHCTCVPALRAENERLRFACKQALMGIEEGYLPPKIIDDLRDALLEGSE